MSSINAGNWLPSCLLDPYRHKQYLVYFTHTGIHNILFTLPIQAYTISCLLYPYRHAQYLVYFTHTGINNILFTLPIQAYTISCLLYPYRHKQYLVYFTHTGINKRSYKASLSMNCKIFPLIFKHYQVTCLMWQYLVDFQCDVILVSLTSPWQTYYHWFVLLVIDFSSHLRLHLSRKTNR